MNPFPVVSLALILVAELSRGENELFLTPLISSGQIEEAKRQSRVESLISSGQIEEAKRQSRVGSLVSGNEYVKRESYSGYLTVNESCNSNLFFWFFKAEKNVFAPTVLWLQGPPGETSLSGLFLENGPYVPIHENVVQGREFDWTKKFNMIYIDAPVGTGFSFTDDEACYARNQEMVRDDLFEGLQQLYTMFPEIQPYDFFVVGESYGGKYGPAIAHKIHENKAVAKMKLKGMAIGDGWSDPETQAYYSDFLFQISLIDVEEAKFMKAEQDRYIQMIRKGDFVGALKVFAPLVDGEGSWLRNVTGFSWFNNFLKASPPSSAEGQEWDFRSFFKSNESRDAIHVGSRMLSDGKKVGQHLEGDIMNSVKPWVGTLLENYRVLIYNGQLDIIVAPSLTENYIRTIDWSGAEEYVKAPKAIWKLDPNDVEPAGYLKKSAKFHRAILRNGGHNFIFDQPRVALQLIDSFIHERC